MNEIKSGSNPPVAVIILNWNGEKLLREFLPAVIANTNPDIARIIVADNGSTDSSVEILKKEFPSVEIMYFVINHGFAEGYNLAIERCRQFPYAVLLNSDVAPRHGWVDTLYKFMTRHPDCGACQPKLLSYTEPGKFEYAGASGGFIDRNGFPYCRGRIFTDCEDDHGQYDTPMQVDWASGAAMMVSTRAYLECGGLDASFFAHMEEIDLCWRMRLAGFTVWAVPEAEVMHLGGGSLPPSSPRKTYLNFRNNLLMLHKNLPESCRSGILLRRRLLDTVAWAKNIASLSWNNAKAIIKAHNDFRAMYKNIPASGARENLLVNRPNILIEYYLRRHRKFSEIHARAHE